METIDTNKQTNYTVLKKKINNNLILSNIEDSKETIVQGFGNVTGKINGYMKVNNIEEDNLKLRNRKKTFYKKIIVFS